MIAFTLNRHRLLAGVSASALLLAAQPARAGEATNPFARTSNATVQAAQAAATRATTAAAASTASQRALAAFARASAIRRGMDAAQAAARATAAAQASAFKGIGAGALEVDPRVASDPSLWLNAKPLADASTGADGRTKVVVEQTDAKAILNWKTFNVGTTTDLTFNQAKADWAVLNRVNDPSADPTRILGTIKAPGTVMVLNRNGVIFGGASQVNVGSLLAAAGRMTDTQFLNNGLYSVSGSLSQVVSEAVNAMKVEAGARITTDTPPSVTKGGGYVMLLGGTVTNEGSIETPRGQTLLAAGDAFAIRAGYAPTESFTSADTAQRLSTVRGSELMPLFLPDSAGGTVTNNGTILSTQGDITLTGRTVAQNGVAISTTTVNQRGTIHLVTPRNDVAGSVTLGQWRLSDANGVLVGKDASYTAILPEFGSSDTALNAQRDALITESAAQDIRRGDFINLTDLFSNRSLLGDRQDQSRIEIVSGGGVTFAGRTEDLGGSITQAQGGQVVVTAKKAIAVGREAVIDVSGRLGVALDVSDNALLINVQGNELRDSPLNRDNPAKPLFSGAKEGLWIDARNLVYVPAGTDGYTSDRYYTAGGLLEAGGYVGTTPHSIGEWTALGGSVTFEGASVTSAPGSFINLAGGSLDYASGYIRQSILQGTDGRLYTADQAPSDVRFVSIGRSYSLTHPRWGEQYTEVYQNPFTRRERTTWQEGYVVGRDAGVLRLKAPSVTLEGAIEAGIVNGAKQSATRPVTVVDGYKLGQTQVSRAGGLSLTTGALVIGQVKPSEPAEGSDTPVASWIDSVLLNESGFGNLTIVAADLTLEDSLAVSTGGALSLTTAGALSIDHDLTARGGSVAISATDIDISGTISTRGLWTNALLDADNLGGLAYRNGGAIGISGTSILLRPGGVIDASSGGAVLSLDQTLGGVGGNITLAAAEVSLDGTIASYGFTRGGQLSLSVNGVISIGAEPLASNGLILAGQPAPENAVLSFETVLPVGSKAPFPISASKNVIDPGQTLTENTYYNSRDYVTVGPDGWTIPTDNYVIVNDQFGNYYPQGSTVPAGTVLSYIYFYIQPGNSYTLPLASFPNGIPVYNYQVEFRTGEILTLPATLLRGREIAAGTVFEQDIRILKTLELSTDFFGKGFSSYSLKSPRAVNVAEDSRVDVVQPVRQFTAASFTAATGADPASFAPPVLPDLFQADIGARTVTQRTGADLLIGTTASTGTAAPVGTVTIGKGAAITVDPGRRVSIGATDSLIIDGSISARGGIVELVDTRYTKETTQDPGLVWLGGDTRIDVSGLAYTATDRNGARFGTVLDGGSVFIGSVNAADGTSSGIASTNAMVVLRPGASVDASGASATFDLPVRSPVPGAAGAQPLAVASDGGLISLSSYNGIFVDEAVAADGSYTPSLRAAAGGAGASGGTLALTLENPLYVGIPDSPAKNVARILTIRQEQTATGLAADLLPEDVATDPALVLANGAYSADQIVKGGFDNLTLHARGAILFDGDVSLALGRSLTISQGRLKNTTADATVSLSAPYVLLSGRSRIVDLPPYRNMPYDPDVVPDLPLGGTLSITGGLIDVADVVRAVYDQTTLTSRGDLRMVPGKGTFSQYASVGSATFAAAGDLDVTAAQIYPATSVSGSLIAGRVPVIDETGLLLPAEGSVLSIHGPGGAAPAMPYSLFGTLSLQADTILQGGVVRAPLGGLSLNGTTKVQLLPGSITSVSARGLVIPYGGTVDGLTYRVDGQSASLLPSTVSYEGFNGPSIQISSDSVVSDAGSLLDLSGGGTILGAGFISGRGGSVDTLLAPIAGGKVYALVPGATVAPLPGGYTSAWTGARPEIGRQVTIPAGVPGLAAGTYTLMPANYALLPGAFRLELGTAGGTGVGTGPAGSDVVAMRNGSYALKLHQGIAGTQISDMLATSAVITPGAVWRTYAQYDETSYATFQVNTAKTLGKLRGGLEADGKALSLVFTANAESAPSSALDFNGKADFNATAGGFDGRLSVGGGSFYNKLDQFVLTGPGSTTVNGAKIVTVSAAEVSAVGAPNLRIAPEGRNVIVESGAKLTGGTISLYANIEGYYSITLKRGAEINTLGRGFNGLDTTDGVFAGDGLLVSNGAFSFSGRPSIFSLGTVTIEEGASLYSDGTIGIQSNAINFDGAVNIGTRSLFTTAATINVGTDAAIGQVGDALPDGLIVNQRFLDNLFAGNPVVGAPALERLVLGASQSVNFFGSVDLDTRDPATGTSRLGELIFQTPAIYGYGSANDAVKLTTDTLVWAGFVARYTDANFNPLPPESGTPGPRIPGLGTGGSFTVDANVVSFGFPTRTVPNRELTLDRLMLGFSDVTLNAAQRVVADGKGTFSAYLDGPDATRPFDASAYRGSGGRLTFNTPLLTGENAASLAIRTGALTIAGQATAATPGTLGAQIDLFADSIALDTAVVLPTGRLTMTADRDIALGAGSRIDLTGKTVPFYDVTKYTWGGDVSLTSTAGSIVQQAGAVLDVSAANEDAGVLSVSALAGTVALGGTIRGSGGAGYRQGEFSVGAGRLGTGTLSADFASLNAVLDASGFTARRDFDLRQGDLVVGNGVHARHVAIAANGGSLTVNGTIDAAGEREGSIRLAARDDLVLASSAVLDLRGTRLNVDSYGNPIEATNRGTIELASSQGWVRLGAGATMDLGSPDGVARGRIDINTGRVDEASGDIRIDAAGPLAIKGAAALAVSGFWTYSPGDANGTVVQDSTAANVPAGALGLDQIDARTRLFYDNALANTGLQARLAGLRAYGTYSLRPGIEIVGGAASGGKLTVLNDLDLSRYRYGPDADRTPTSATYGRGAPLSFVIRAAGDLDIKGSITDGFGVPNRSPDENQFRDRPKEIVSTIIAAHPGTEAEFFNPQSAPVLAEDWLLTDISVPYPGFAVSSDFSTYYYPGDTVPAGTALAGGYYFTFYPDYIIPATKVDTVKSQAPVYAIAPMLAPGMHSASIRLVSGADLAAADTRTVRGSAALAGTGNMVLDDYHGQGKRDGSPTAPFAPIPSVIRTGTGSLDLLAGGDVTLKSLYGIYTAGTDTKLASGNEDFEPVRPYVSGTGSVFGGDTAFENTLNAQTGWYPDHGGDLTLGVGGDFNNFIDNSYGTQNGLVGGWLWRMGANELGQKTGWFINFGSYASNKIFSGFSGIGTLGGGNATVRIDGDVGNLRLDDPATYADDFTIRNGVVVSVGGTGRVTAVNESRDGGTVVGTGGGDVDIRVGGRIDPSFFKNADNLGTITNIRGDINVSARTIGSITPGQVYTDPRAVDPFDPQAVVPPLQNNTTLFSGLTFVPGDTAIDVRALGDLMIVGTGNPTLQTLRDVKYMFQGPADAVDDLAPGTGVVDNWFSLWTERTQLNGFSAGGNLEAFDKTSLAEQSRDLTVLPAKISLVASRGSILANQTNQNITKTMLPAASSRLELLAQRNVNLGSNALYMSGADLDSVPNVYHPAYLYSYNKADGTGSGRTLYNTYATITVSSNGEAFYTPVIGTFAFKRNLPDSDLYAADPDPVRLYAVTGDLLNIQISTAKRSRFLSGRDIVNFSSFNQLLNTNATDVSVISAARDIIYAGLEMRGPGALEMTAGRNLYQADKGVITSIGPVAIGDTRLGADIAITAGAGIAGPDYEALKAYLDPANLIGTVQGQPVPLEGSGKVAKVYQEELADWLAETYGYAGTATDAMAYFNALLPEQQHVFLRRIYYAELTAGGREYNDPAGSRFGSYIRGRNAIAALFPATDAAGAAIARGGDITMFGGSGVRTLFGGNIQLLTPAGRTVLGVEGTTPPSTAGIVTQGKGDVQIYSQGSILLGLSRILTTFGGDILAWSAEGDINSGRGSKTTILFTPPKRTYDLLGKVTLAPQVPSTGAGIGTLDPIPEVPAGDIDLIAPLGTVDAGEAGIRVSGNINIAALRVLNAANIAVKGNATGIPVTAAVNTGALTAASNATSAITTEAERLAERARPKPITREVPYIISGQFLGFGQ